MIEFVATFFQPASTCANARLDDIACRLRRGLPQTATRVLEQRLWVDGVNGGWVVLHPQLRGRRARLSVLDTPSHAILCVGAVLAKDGARAILAAYQEGGIPAVRELEGAFSTIIVDKRARRLTAFSDVVGTRALRYVCDGSAITLALTDGGLLAASPQPTAVDLVSAAAVVLAGWSLGGRPLMPAARMLSPDEILQADAGGFSVSKHSILARDGATIDPNGEARARRAYESALVGGLRQEIELDLDSSAPIHFSLTAGVDSRHVLALLLAAGIPPTRMRAQTQGREGSLDVVWAKLICRMLGIRHHVTNPQAPDPAGFERNVNLLAYVMSGATDSKRALTAPVSTDPGPLMLGGLGGEIARGYYYAYASGLATDATAEAIANTLAPKILLTETRAPIHRELRKAVFQRLVQALQAFDRFAINTWSYLDHFYLRERYALWGSLSWRRLWSGVVCPLGSSRAIGALAQLPNPWGDRRLQADMMRRYLPTSLYWMPINERDLLPLHGPENHNRFQRRLVKIGATGIRRLRSAHQGDPSSEKVRAALFANEVYEQVHDALLSQHSLAQQLIERPQLVALLERHRSEQSALRPLGDLVTMDAWYKQLRESRERYVHDTLPESAL